MTHVPAEAEKNTKNAAAQINNKILLNHTLNRYVNGANEALQSGVPRLRFNVYA